jgi:hypothetical protein
MTQIKIYGVLPTAPSTYHAPAAQRADPANTSPRADGT